VSALRGLAVVGAPDRDHAQGEIDICLEQAEKLALAPARPDRRGEEWSPVRSERGEHRRHLLCTERLEELAGNFAPLHRRRWVDAQPATTLCRLGEDRVHRSAQRVQALRRQVVDARLKEILDAR